MSSEATVRISALRRAPPHDPAPQAPAATPAPKSFADIERELALYERAQRERLNLVDTAIAHWSDSNPRRFTRAQRATTTLLLGGLTRAQDYLVQGAWRGLGYQVEVLAVPDTEALRFGREFGNRGQCNPTYFTVGNLVKHLTRLREHRGLTSAEIVERYVFITAGACGPCRFGTYATEYRKALRDAGFEGFRVLLFQQAGGLKQATGEGDGLEMTPRFFVALLKALLAGDALNAIGYRIRPYEQSAGATDQALEACKELLHGALAHGGSMLRALWRCRRLLRAVAVDRLQAKPKVSIIGEFWAMTTEGDGNHRLQRFLEAEGAEVDIQLVTAWLLYSIWAARWDTRQRLRLKGQDAGRSGLAGARPRRRLALLAAAEWALRGTFGVYARLIGLGHCHLPDMDALARTAHAHYDNHLRGGEGHMEIGKVIDSVRERRHHMVISVKPFGCMPSAGVSDGIQSLIGEQHPEAIFCAIETTGDGAANLQSRVMMHLFKARQRAAEEFAAIAARAGCAPEDLRVRLAGQARFTNPLRYPHRPKIAGTAARLLADAL